jgi:hypothetical protein
MKVNAYGRALTVVEEGGCWRVFESGVEGKRRPARDIYIPDGMGADEVLQYLGDLLHEYASERYPTVFEYE